MPSRGGALSISVQPTTIDDPIVQMKKATTSTTTEDLVVVAASRAPTARRQKFTAAQVRRAAGSQNLEALKEALVGWTNDELDRMASEDGKNAVHMAAWQGCVDNLTHLLDRVGCSVNTIATGTYSYGKTPLFFAATRCRDEVVALLLDRGACVKIVNNKGQTPLSIASSHLTPATIELIEHAEQIQHQQPWVNYRATHSDGLEYGDLDPRFLDRPLREDDVVTPRAINATTKQSRRGSFLRRNPHLHVPPTATNQQSAELKRTQVKRTKSKKKLQSMTDNQREQLHDAWTVLQTFPLDVNDGGKALLNILRVYCQIQRPWINEVATQLRNIVPNSDDVERIVAAASALVHNEGDRDAARVRSLLDRVRTQALQQSVSEGNESLLAPSGGSFDFPRPPSSESVTPSASTTGRRKRHPTLPLSSPVWREACHLVSNLSLRVFMPPPPPDNDRCVLRLSRPSVWVDSVDALQTMRDDLASAPLVAFDTEWSDVGHIPGSSVVSTLQLAVNDERTWIIDMAGCQGEGYEPPRRQYLELCRDVVQSLFETKVVLGFALGRDIVKLEEWLDRPLCLTRCLDLQHYFSRSKHNVPGLAACARQVLISMPEDQNNPGHLPARLFHLDKSQQCSDWNQRPLTASQLSYAGLDAAILPYLLAEQARSGWAKCGEMSKS